MRAVFVATALIAFACGGRPPVPPRGVVETDLGSWKFRRFQGPLLDIEVWVAGNKAEANSASYITAQAEQRGRIDDKDLVNVFVTRYERPDGVVRATVKLARRLAQEGYQVEEDKIAGARTLAITGHGEAWVMWPAQLHVVKVGGRGRTDVPAAMVATYVDRYPSQLPGGSLEGALPPGPDEAPKQLDQPAYDATNPHPDVEHYDPNKVKLPDGSDPDAARAGSGAAPAAGATGDDATAKPAEPAKPTKPTKAKPRRKPKPKPSAPVAQ
jgi:hypothetical protein